MPDEHFSSHLPALLASTTATLVATFGLSFLGAGGTLAGLVGGSLVTGVGAWWFERWFRKTAAVARTRSDWMRRRGRPLTDTETQMIERIAEAKHPRIRGFPWRLASLGTAVILVATGAVIAVIELGTGKPVSAVVQSKHSHGLFVPQPAVTVTRTRPVFTSPPSPTVSFTPPPSSSPATLPATAPPATVPATVTVSSTPTPVMQPTASPAPTPSG